MEAFQTRNVGAFVRGAVALGLLLVIPGASAALGGGSGSPLAERLRHGPGVTNHPVNIIPSSVITLADDLPLAGNGTITCKTCHETLPALDGSTAPYLRGYGETRPEPGEFCTKCHNVPEIEEARTVHWLALGRAHLMPGRKSGVASAGLDAESRRCLGCHDGVTAGDTGHSALHVRGFAWDRNRAHPVGVRYPASTPKHFDSPLRPAAMLPASVRLPGGMVSCVSCHNLYGRDRHMLSVPIEGSKLCLTCHEMD